MNRKIAKLFVRWVWRVTSMLVYQSNIFPREQLQELVQEAEDLVKALEEAQR